MIEALSVGPLDTNCWILSLKGPAMPKGSCLVVDPGGDAPEIIARLGKLHLRPWMIVLTHGHLDHVAALPDIVAAFSSDGGRAPDVAIHSADAAYLGSGAESLHLRDFRRVGGAEFVVRYWHGACPPTRILGDGDHIGPFQVLSVPGHTPGSIALWDEQSGELVSGDCLFEGGIGRTDLPGGDQGAMDRSLRRLLSLPASTKVYPGHGRITRIGREQVAF